MKLKMKQMKLKNGKIKLNEQNLKYKAGKYKYDFQQYESIRSFGESNYYFKIGIHEADMD